MTITLTREEAQQLLYYMDDGGDYTDDYGKLIETLRARLAQPEPDPVAWYWSHGIEFTIAFDKTDGHAPMYLHPPQREWQSLTDEEVTACWSDGFNVCEQKTVADLRDFIARSIEAKLKEKNT